MSSFDDPNFYLAQAAPLKSSTQQTRSPSPPTQTDDIFSVFSSPTAPDQSPQLHLTPSNQPHPSTSTTKKSTKRGSSKSQLQEQLQLLLTTPNGVSMWCDFNQFDAAIAQKIQHLQGHELLTLSKPDLMTLLKSPKHGLLVWTRLKHLADAVSEHQISVNHLVNAHQNSNQSQSSSSSSFHYPPSHQQIAQPYHSDHPRHSQNQQSGAKYPTNQSNQHTTLLQIPQYNALLDSTSITPSSSPAHQHTNNVNPRFTTINKSLYQPPTADLKPSSTTTSTNQPSNVFDYHEDSSAPADSAEYQYHSLSPPHNPRKAQYEQYDSPDYASYSNSDDIHPLTSPQTHRSIYLSHQPTGTGSLHELLDIEPANLMKYFSWNGFTQSLYNSYEEWVKIVKAYQETRPDVYIDVARRVKQRQEHREYKDSLRKAQHGDGCEDLEYDSIGHPNDHESQQHTTTHQHSSRYENSQDKQGIGLTGNNKKYSNYGANDDFGRTEDDHDDSFGPPAFSLPPQSHIHQPHPSSPQVQCEFGTCEYLTELRCSQPSCHISLCGKHIVKDIITGYFYCPTCYQQTYTYSMMNNGLTQYCNIQ